MNNIHHQTSVDLTAFNRIDMNLYPLFMAIYELKHISRSAEKLFISQSAASHALNRLRSQLNDDLFIRIGHEMHPTPFAEQLYPIIQKALISIQNASFAKLSFDPKSIKNLKIAIHDEIEPLIFPNLIRHFRDIGLNLDIISIKLDRNRIKESLSTQQIDFVIDIEQNYGVGIEFQAIAQDRFVLCSQQKNIDLDHYKAAKHIGVSSRKTGILVEDVYLNKLDIKRNIQLRCQHYSTALQILVQQSDLMLTIPHSILSHLKVDARLNIQQLPLNFPLMNIGMFFTSNWNLNSRLIFLKSEIEKNFA